jgi:hypothetical protein
MNGLEAVISVDTRSYFTMMIWGYFRVPDDLLPRENPLTRSQGPMGPTSPIAIPTAGNPSVKRFRVAFSFAGEKRPFIAEIATILAKRFGEATILFDKFHEAEFARRDLGFYLPDLYRDHADLIVVIVCRDYEQKEWCGLEWDAIFDLLKGRQNDDVMFCRFDKATVKGLYSTAGFVDLDGKTPEHVATRILERLGLNEGRPKDYYLNRSGGMISGSSTAPPTLLKPARTRRNIPSVPPQFVGRDSTLDEIAQYFSGAHGPGMIPEWTIYGQGGMGKTTLAAKYAWTHDIDYPGGIFMVECSTDDFCTAICRLFPLIFDPNDPDYENSPKAARRVTDNLSRCPERFLLLLDNVGSLEHWRQIQASGFLPIGSYDRIITTTATDIPTLRSRPLERLSIAEGIGLLAAFRDDVSADEDKQTVGSLVGWFGGVPFYLSVLGMYMKRTPRLSWKTYAASLEQQGLTAVRATEDAAGQLPDRYPRRIDEVLDKLLNSLNENECRALEYSVLLFPGEVNAYALLNILTYDVNTHFRPMPGYAFPARHLLETLEDDQILTARGVGNNKVFSIHEILRRKLIERIYADEAYKTNLLRQVYNAAVNRICSGDQLISCDDSAPNWPPIGVYYNSMHSIFRALEECGFIPPEAGLYNYWIAFADRMGTARRLASKLGGRVDIQMSPASATHMHQTPLVVVEQADCARACAFTAIHGGQVKKIHDPSRNNTSFYVVISINS